MYCVDAGASSVAQMVKNVPAMEETQVWSLGQEDPLEKGMAIHSSVLAWRIPWIEEPGGLQFRGSQRVRHSWTTNISLFWYQLLSLRQMKKEKVSRVWLFATPWTVAHQARLSMGFSRQEYWSGLPCPPPRDPPNPGSEPTSLRKFPALGGGFFTNSATWGVFWDCVCMLNPFSRVWLCGL